MLLAPLGPFVPIRAEGFEWETLGSVGWARVGFLDPGTVGWRLTPKEIH